MKWDKFFAIPKDSIIIRYTGKTIGEVIDKLKDDEEDPHRFNFYELKDLCLYKLTIEVK